MVLDPIDPDAWGADFATDDPAVFLDTFWKSANCMVFVDEAGDNFGRFETDMAQCATKGRHSGHCLHFISQRAKMLSPTVRTQCTKLVLFNVAYEDAKMHSVEWNRPQLLTCVDFPPGIYFECGRWGALQKGDCFT